MKFLFLLDSCKCNYRNFVDSQYTKHYNKAWWCIKCFISLFTFTKSNNHKIFSLFIDELYCKADTDGHCLLLKPPQNMSDLFNEFHSNFEKFFNCKNYDTSRVKRLKISNDKKSLFFFYLNTCSLLRNVHDSQYPIQSTNIDLHVITISESEILKSKQSVFDINLPSIAMRDAQLNHQLVTFYCVLETIFHINSENT